MKRMPSEQEQKVVFDDRERGEGESKKDGTDHPGARRELDHRAR